MTTATEVKRKLNIGCGTDIRDGWINMDIAALPGVDMVHNIENLPLPFEDNSFDEVLCQDILEHVEYIPILKEIHRIMRPKAVLVIRVPHFTSRNNFLDPTHKKRFSWRTFEFFTKKSFLGRNYYFDFYFSHVERAKITFIKTNRLFFNYLIEPIVNLKDGVKDLYEETMISRLFPAYNIEVKIVK